MKPKFKNTLAWEQAQILMQPCLIRVLDNIRKELEQSDWQGKYEEIQEPYPGYLLRLKNGEKLISIDIWELCYQVCFRDYNPPQVHFLNEATMGDYEVDIDTRLINEIGEVDWHFLETKAQNVVGKIFANLPTDRES